MPKTSESMRKAINKYQKEKLDEIKLRVPKGKKEVIKTYADSKGESVNALLNRLIDTELEKDTPKE